MESKSKIFQPKVIIGSITSFLVAAVGIIAVFFPNLLNLEKSSMSEGQFLLSDDEKTHKKLWEFLDKNQGKVVQLEIAYCADFERMNFGTIKKNDNVLDQFATDRFQVEEYYFRAIDFMPKWLFGLGSIDEYTEWRQAKFLTTFAKQNNLKFYYYEGIGKQEGETTTPRVPRTYFTIDDKIGNLHLVKQQYNAKILNVPIIIGEINSFATFQFGQDIHPDLIGLNLEKGGIGLAIDNQAKDIFIPYPSNKNKKYVWIVGFENEVFRYLDKQSSIINEVKKTCKMPQMSAKGSYYEGEHFQKLINTNWGGSTFGYIKGAFYIHDKERLTEGGPLMMMIEEDDGALTDPEYYYRDQINLEPFDKKDMELRKY